MALVAVLVAKLLSVSIIVLGIAVGVLSRYWWHVALGSVGVAIVAEALLMSLQAARHFNLLFFLIGIVAALAWASAAFAIKRRMAS